MAEGVLRYKLERRGLKDDVKVDSAGTHASQVGRSPDPRAQNICRDAGVDISRGRARQVKSRDFERFDYILAMGQNNVDWLVSHCPEACQPNIALLGTWAEALEIPDPYYGNQEGFAQVLHLLDGALDAFLEQLLAERA
jgi:low molecular weight protein-tyrosine phosphatase